jgi:hypothetical protein
MTALLGLIAWLVVAGILEDEVSHLVYPTKTWAVVSFFGVILEYIFVGLLLVGFVMSCSQGE